jgi:hypothetical protein
MAVLQAFDTPARLRDTSDANRAVWSGLVKEIFRPYVNRFRQLYDPTASDTPADARVESIAWTAFPARLLRGATSEEARWRLADNDRNQQDEYCEWSVQRDAGGKVVRVTFTSEVPEYFEFLADNDPQQLLDFYRRFVSPEARLEDLMLNGSYRRDNRWNVGTNGPLAHLRQDNNTLGAAVDLVANATVPRQINGVPVITKQALAKCASLGNEFRNSDPQIAASVNSATRGGDEVSLQDPIGLYIHGLNTVGLRARDGADPAQFWTIERGTPEHALRARFEVPPGRGYVVGDVLAFGRPIAFGAQLADRVSVRINALVKRANHTPAAVPCGARL